MGGGLKTIPSNCDNIGAYKTGREDLIMNIIIWLIVGGVAGRLAGLIVKGYGFGLIGNIIVGIIGALLAGWLFPIGFGAITAQPVVNDIIAATIGAVILLVVIGLIRR